MKKALLTLCLLATAAFLAACPLTTREDVQHDQDDQREMKEQVSNIQRTRADTEQRLSDLQNDMRVIAGRVDTVEHNDQVASQNNRTEIENLKKIIVGLSDRMKLLEQHMDATEQKLLAAIQSVSVANQAPPPQPPAIAAAAAEAGHSKKSDSPLGEGDDFLNNKEYKRAIIQYQSYLTKKPRGSKAAEATYKIGYCFAELGMKKDAKEFYQETIESFPGTVPAKKAKAKLAQLK